MGTFRTRNTSLLKEEDRIALKKEIPTYLKYVDANLWLYDGAAVGFSGINKGNLEMLFIDPEHFRKGFGTEILQHLLTEDHIQKVDVNKDNEQALNFYIKNGFKSYKESSHDEQGRDYPIIHLKL
ncbi:MULTISPECIES: GNAT family N-acetyltransferase [Mammaliicoccus]|uniref:GNAT family N-acetyltransferase n=1 Tax=Mammaliicoccus TaxID=2803850 RepID=UPI001EFE00DE|nr:MULTISPECIES: GNAT family N-acetyltransferase [Mammaliicoccus]